MPALLHFRQNKAVPRKSALALTVGGRNAFYCLFALYTKFMIADYFNNRA